MTLYPINLTDTVYVLHVILENKILPILRAVLIINRCDWKSFKIIKIYPRKTLKGGLCRSRPF